MLQIRHLLSHRRSYDSLPSDGRKHRSRPCEAGSRRCYLPWQARREYRTDNDVSTSCRGVRSQGRKPQTGRHSDGAVAPLTPRHDNHEMTPGRDREVRAGSRGATRGKPTPMKLPE